MVSGRFCVGDVEADGTEVVNGAGIRFGAGVGGAVRERRFHMFS